MKKGFTLIELLVVVGIIGILASVVLATLNSAREKGCLKPGAKLDSELCKNYFKNNPDKAPVSTEKKKSETRHSVAPSEDVPLWVLQDREPTDQELCGTIPDEDVRNDCLQERYQSKMIQECISRYTE